MIDLTHIAPPLLAASTGGLWIAYGGFILLVGVLLALDLGVFHRHARTATIREAAGWSVVWVSFGLLFSVFVYAAYDNQWLGLGAQARMFNPAAAHDAGQPLIVTGEVSGGTAALHYLTGYVVEKSLAMDNIFIIAMLFGFFAIPNKYQHRVLFWGIIGAVVMRGLMIGVGGELIMRCQWILIFFGLFLLITALKMVLMSEHSDPTRNPIVRLVKRMYPVTDQFHGQRFFVRIPQSELNASGSRDHPVCDLGSEPVTAPGQKMVWAITPLMLALIMVEMTDLIFAVDSIPAIFAITPDPFIVFTSNIFAILGLRSLYFCLAAAIEKFHYLKPALVLILAFVGIKLLLLSAPPYLDLIGLADRKSIKIDPLISLGVVLTLLGGAVGLSVLRSRKHVAVT